MVNRFTDTMNDTHTHMIVILNTDRAFSNPIIMITAVSWNQAINPELKCNRITLTILAVADVWL